MKKGMTRRLFLCTGAAAGGAVALGGRGLVKAAASAAAPAQAGFVRLSVFDPRARIDSYRRAVEVMQERSRVNADDPRGWTFQAAIHGSSTQGQFFNKCEHASWWFLPWHRAYLYFFERIVREASGDRDFTLPYWDWNDSNHNALPSAFSDSASKLFDDTRSEGVNLGEPLVGPELNISKAMGARDFLGSGVSRGFGGVPRPASRKELMERPPHDTIHVLVSGNMGHPRTAGLDPIFWLHHANVDRLWDTWLASGRTNPTDANWRNNLVNGARRPFVFFDETGQRVEVTTAEFLPGGSRLDYSYDNLEGNSPLLLSNRDLRNVLERGPRSAAGGGAVALTTQHRRSVQEKRRTVFGDARRVELTAAENRVVLGAAPVTVRAVIPENRRPRFKAALDLGREDVETQMVINLNVEDVRSQGAPGVVYRVYLNQPDATASVDPDEANYIGSVVLFQSSGHGSGGGGHDAGHGENFSFDITDLGQALRERGRLDETKLDVTFVSKGVGGRNVPRSEVSIGRISVSVER